MTQLDLDQISARLSDILIEERQLLKNMDVQQLVARSNEKLALIKSLEAALAGKRVQDVSGQTGRALARIVQLAWENGQHFNAVRQGMSNVINRISSNGEDIRAGTYNQYGEQLKFRGSVGGYLRKA